MSGPQGWPLGPGEWWACEYPERPPEPEFSRLHNPGTCPGCCIAVEARLQREPEATGKVSRRGTGQTLGDYLRLCDEAAA